MFVFGLFFVFVLGCSQLTKPTRKDTPDFRISVKELEKELNENRNAAFAKYENKTVAITGKVEAKMDMSVVLVSPDNSRFIVQCFFEPAERESVRQIQRGKEYTLIGIFTVYNNSQIISKCKMS
jgi:hypothetical protein